MKPLIALMIACAALTTIAPAPALAQRGSTLSNASELVAGGSALVLLGSMSAVAGSANVVVASVETVGESTVIVLKGASEAANATIRLSGKAAQGVSVVAGTAVSVTAMASGYALVAAGEVIAFIPNEIGKSLIHHSPAGASRN